MKKKFKIKLGAHQQIISLIPREDLGEIIKVDQERDTWGVYKWPYYIFIAEELEGSAAFSVFIHELIEAIDSHYEFGLSHSQICGLESVFSQVLLDNKVLFKELLK